MIQAKIDQIFKRPDALIGAIQRAGLLHLRETLDMQCGTTCVCSFVGFGRTRLCPGRMRTSQVSQVESLCCVCQPVFIPPTSPSPFLANWASPPSPRKSLTVKHDVISCNKIPSPLFLDKACRLMSHNFVLNTLRARD